MPKIYGYGGRSGGPLTGSPVPVPTKPVVHRGRPALSPSGFKMLNVEEFTEEQLARTAPKPRASRRGARRPVNAGGPRAQFDSDLIVRLYVEEKKTLKQVAAEVGCSHQTALRYLQAAEVKMRPRYYAPNRPPLEQGPASKVCEAPECGATMTRRDGERLDAWKRRRTCTRVCASVIGIAARRAA